MRWRYGLFLGLLLWYPQAFADPSYWLRSGESIWSGPGSAWLRFETAGGARWNRKWSSSLAWENENRYGQNAWEAEGRLGYSPDRGERFSLQLGGGSGAWVPYFQTQLGWYPALGQGSLHLLVSELCYPASRLSELGTGQSWYWGNWRAYAQVTVFAQQGQGGDYLLWGSQASLTRYFGPNRLTLFGGDGLSPTGNASQPLARNWSVALVWQQRLTRSWTWTPVLQVRRFAGEPLSWGAGLFFRYRF